MIDIQPYIDKLEVLKEYMAMKNGNSLWGMEYWVDLQVCPDNYYISNKLPIPNPRKMIIPTPTFEEYYNLYKQTV